MVSARRRRNPGPSARPLSPARAKAFIELERVGSGPVAQLVLHHANADDHIFSIVRRTGNFYEADLLAELGKRLAPGDLVIDVGANIGNHTLFFAAVCGCRVIAIEPNPLAFALLVENVEANGLGALVTALNIAAGAAPGQARIEDQDERNLGAASAVVCADGTIGVQRIDAIPGARGARLIKIDVEGAEPEVLAGATALIKGRRKPIVTAEAPDRAAFEAVDRILAPLGYIATGTLAFTPTHLFEAVPASRRHELLPALGRAVALNAVATHELRREVDKLRHRLAALEAASLHAAPG